MTTAYSFTVLRYVHDVMTGEFVNIGVVLFAPETKFVGVKCLSQFGRLEKFFPDADAEHIASLVKDIEKGFAAIREKLDAGLWSGQLPPGVSEIAVQVLPADDSSLQWSEPGGGVTVDPASELARIFVRMVVKNDDTGEKNGPALRKKRRSEAEERP